MRQRVVYFVMIWVAVTSVSAQEAKSGRWTTVLTMHWRKYPIAAGQNLTGREFCRRENRQSRTISQSVVQYRTECDEPSVSGNQ